MSDSRLPKFLLWAVLALPAVPMLIGLSAGRQDLDLLLHPSGEFSARLMLVALMITPLRMLFSRVRWIGWLARHRRSLGVAAFAYAALHTLIYIVDMETLRNMLAEFGALGIWTGWLAFALFIPLAVTSNDASARRLGRNWKTVHRLVYLAAVLTLVHWMFVHNNLAAALVHFVPLALLELYRLGVWARGLQTQAPAV
ncbi:MAG: ferric reductase-like transmembrane domain-containing protein [Gammaproteobacteria bacterium]|nr:ferric reductase-like transmembrane domain-containing protein [Gammaproteobacteria bacterium]